PEALDLLRKAAADSEPRVRLEAIRAASFFTDPEAVEVVLIAADQPMDIYLEYVRRETLRALEPFVKKAIAEGRKLNFTTEAGRRYFLKIVNTDDLLRLPRSAGVFRELLARAGVRDEFRKEAAVGLARLEQQSASRVLLTTLQTQNLDDSARFD